MRAFYGEVFAVVGAESLGHVERHGNTRWGSTYYPSA